MPALAFLRRMVGGRGVCVAQTYVGMRSQPIKPHTLARRALPLPCVRHTLWLLFNAVDVLLRDGCRLRDFLATYSAGLVKKSAYRSRYVQPISSATVPVCMP